MVVLSLFSGRRRPLDIQDCLETLWSGAVGSCQFVVLSIDIAISAEFGDLLAREVVDRWISCILKGEVFAAIAGPPCESLSAVRWQRVGDGRHGPRPLRDARSLWGLQDLAGRDARQVDTANGLLQAALDIAVALLLTGGCSVIEHPAIPVWEPRSSSIWHLPVTKALGASPAVDHFEFDQCMVGQVGRAPTHFMAVRLPLLRKALCAGPRGGRCTHGPRAHRALMGLAADGSWRTAPKKTYPPALCACLAASVVHAAHEARGCEWQDFEEFSLQEAVELLPAGFSACWAPLDPYFPLENDLRADFVG